jgi:DNA-binding SARP family transcriptional activator
VQIGILGPFEVRADDGALADVPGARLRALSIALALEPGRIVSKATLIDWIWGEQPPADPANALQRLVSRLRKALPEGLIEGQPGGYRLTVEPDAVDAVRFERLVAQARDAEGSRRVRLLREALALWRGAAMADVGLEDSEALDAAVARLERLRLTALEDRFDAEVGLGHGAELVAELTELVAAHPVHERLVAALLRALAAAGRDTEALLAYERTREALADLLGVDPSPELSALHVALLRGELGRREADRKTNVRAELTSFVGREADLAAVRELIGEHRLTTLIGPGGSGKTRLATETARTLLGDLPDGVWLVELAGGRRSEGFELIVAATKVPGEVTDEVRAMVYALVVMFVTSGRGDGHEAAEWIHQAYRFSQRSQQRSPLLGLVTPLERMLQAPDASLPAFESLLDSEDPWVRALARMHLGKMRIMLGQGGRDAEHNLELAVAEFRALGERYGISLALSELAEQIAKRGEFSGACEHFEQAITVVTEVGATEDVIRLRTRQALMYWLNGDQDASAAAIAEAERSADGVTWPYAQVELALAKAELARWAGNAQEARHQLGVATAFLGDDAEQASIRAELHDVLGYLADDLDQVRTHRVAAWQAASESGLVPLIAQVIVGVADLAVRLGQYEQAARLLAASVGLRGQPDRSRPDMVGIEQAAQRHLGEARFAEVTREGTQANWSELVEVTLAS